MFDMCGGFCLWANDLKKPVTRCKQICVVNSSMRGCVYLLYRYMENAKWVYSSRGICVVLLYVTNNCLNDIFYYQNLWTVSSLLAKLKVGRQQHHCLMDDSKERKQFSNSLFEESLTILIHIHTVGILMQLLLTYNLLFCFWECSCVALCIAIHFQTHEGPLPLVLLWDCVCLLVSTKHNIYCCLVFFVWLNVAWSCY